MDSILSLHPFIGVGPLHTIALRFANTVICYISVLINYASQTTTQKLKYMYAKKRGEKGSIKEKIYTMLSWWN